MLKKGWSSLLVFAMWLCLTGFSNLGTSEENTFNALLNQLTTEDLEVILVENEWNNRVMAKVEESVSIRAEASTESAMVGKLFKGNAADILEKAEAWTKIQSGEVIGWVSNDYLAFGQEAAERAKTDVKKIATVMTQTLKVRDEASTDANVVDLIGFGEQIEVGNEKDGWLEILYSDGEVDYISADYVDVSYNYGQAKSMAQIEAEEAERRALEEKQKRTKNLGAIAATNDETILLAALIQAEGGNQPYEGQVAIGAVVMNRVRSKAFPNSIQAVISAPGQFGPAATGKVASIMAKGPKASCIKAAKAAINGETTVGTMKYFKNAKYSVSGAHIVIGDHVFY